MVRINNRLFLPVATAFLGILWVVVGLSKYGWFVDGKPASGFFPVIAGAILVFVSILAFFSEMKLETPFFAKLHLYPVITTISVVLLAVLIGFFPALTIYVFGWLRWFEKYSYKKTLTATAITILGMYGIFAMWLRVPFPLGIIVEGILG